MKNIRRTRQTRRPSLSTRARQGGVLKSRGQAESPAQSASYIVAILADLIRIADKAQLSMVSYLLSMAQAEALANQVRASEGAFDQES